MPEQRGEGRKRKETEAIQKQRQSGRRGTEVLEIQAFAQECKESPAAHANGYLSMHCLEGKIHVGTHAYAFIHLYVLLFAMASWYSHSGCLSLSARVALQSKFNV